MKFYKLKCSGASERGSRRENQDNLRFGDFHAFIDQTRSYAVSRCFSTEKCQVFCVCDGVGGAENGDMASTGALVAVKQYLAEENQEQLEDMVLHAAERANCWVQEFYQCGGRVGGSTLAMVAILGEQYVALNIGDSPIFLYSRRKRALQELSVRHTQAWDLRRRGEIPDQKSEHTLVYYLGKANTDAQKMAHICTGTLAPGDSLLLCSDGVSEAFSQKKLCRRMRWKVSAKKLTASAAKAPNADNCTAVCIRTVEEE